MATTTASRGKSNRETAATASDIENELVQLRNDITSLTKTVAAFGSGKADQVKSKADQKTAEIVEISNQAIEALGNEIEDLEKQLRSKVRANPFQTIAIAAGLGFLVALLVRR